MIKFNETEYKALCKIIDNIENKEFIHWEESGKPNDHIYHHIITISNALIEFKYRADCERQLQLREEQS